MKGVSQIIGIIMLMAIALSIVSIFAGWAPDLAGDITEGAAETVQSDIQCSDASFRINNAMWVDAENELRVEVENIGSQRFSELELVAIVDGQIMEEDTLELLDPQEEREIRTGGVTEEPTDVQMSSTECPELSEDTEVQAITS